jgi:hypothetical protein
MFSAGELGVAHRQALFLRLAATGAQAISQVLPLQQFSVRYAISPFMVL